MHIKNINPNVNEYLKFILYLFFVIKKNGI